MRYIIDITTEVVMRIGDLFRFRINKARPSVHTDVDGFIGFILAKPNQYGQYKVQVGHKTLWLLLQDMEAL